MKLRSLVAVILIACPLSVLAHDSHDEFMCQENIDRPLWQKIYNVAVKGGTRVMNRTSPNLDEAKEFLQIAWASAQALCLRSPSQAHLSLQQEIYQTKLNQLVQEGRDDLFAGQNAGKIELISSAIESLELAENMAVSYYLKITYVHAQMIKRAYGVKADLWWKAAIDLERSARETPNPENGSSINSAKDMEYYAHSNMKYVCTQLYSKSDQPLPARCAEIIKEFTRD